MDGFGILRDVLRAYVPPKTGDDILRDILSLVAQQLPPDRMYDAELLHLWATQHGYARSEDMAALMALLKDARDAIPAPSGLSSALAEAIYKHGGHTV